MNDWWNFLFGKYGELFDIRQNKQYTFQTEKRLLAFTDQWILAKALGKFILYLSLIYSLLILLLFF
jgi:hypothetical protein